MACPSEPEEASGPGVAGRPRPFGNVLAGVDGGPGGRDAIALARVLLAQGGRLTLAHVSRPGLGLLQSGQIAAAELENARLLLAEERAVAGVQAELLSTSSSSVAGGLHALAERLDADLLVVGSSHRSLLGRVLAGNDARSALDGAPCAVAVAPAGYAQEPRSIAAVGVGYDGSPESEAALALARAVAGAHGAKVHAREVVQTLSSAYVGFGGGAWGGELPSVLAAAREQMAQLAGVEGDAVLGVAGEELTALSAEVDLLVVGSRGYGHVRGLILGSTSQHLLGHARCALLVLARGAGGSGSLST